MVRSPPGSAAPPLINNSSTGSTQQLDFESGRVLSQVPFEYSSFLDLPPSAFGTCAYIHTYVYMYMYSRNLSIVDTTNVSFHDLYTKLMFTIGTSETPL